MPTVLMTGFPGFLGSQLLPRVLRRDADLSAVCLVQERYRPLAEQRLAELSTTHPVSYTHLTLPTICSV